MKWCRASVLALIVGVLSWSACGDDATGPTVATVEVTPATATIAPGATVQLSATVRDESGDPLSGFTVTWSSDDEAVATVDDNGLVTGEADGTAQISASAGGESGTAEITVVTPVASVEVTPVADTIRAGTTTQLTATPKDADGNALTGRTVTWDSSEDAIATVDASGLVTGVNNGTATITAEVEGQSDAASIAVWVGVTGDWAGTIETFGGTCGLTFSWTEDLNGDFTGDGQLTGPACITVDLTFEGMNNTDGVADSVTFTWHAGGLPDVLFWGNFDGISTITGVMDANLDNGPMESTRSSIVPSAAPAVAGVVVDSRESVNRSYRRPERPRQR